MYFCSSTLRIGIEFRACTIPEFERAVLSKATQSINQVVDGFTHSIGKGERLYIPCGWGLDSESGSGIGAPVGLLEYPCFAGLVNGMYRVFNGLRVFPVLGICEDIARVLSAGLAKCAEALRMREGAVGFDDACFVFTRDVVGTISTGLKKVYIDDERVWVDEKTICKPIAAFANVIMLERLQNGGDAEKGLERHILIEDDTERGEESVKVVEQISDKDDISNLHE